MMMMLAGRRAHQSVRGTTAFNWTRFGNILSSPGESPASSHVGRKAKENQLKLSGLNGHRRGLDTHTPHRSEVGRLGYVG